MDNVAKLLSVKRNPNIHQYAYIKVDSVIYLKRTYDTSTYAIKTLYTELENKAYQLIELMKNNDKI